MTTRNTQKTPTRPIGLRHAHKPPKSERGTNGGKSRFAFCCRDCGPGADGWGVEYGADILKPPTHCPRGHLLSIKGYSHHPGGLTP